MKKFTSLLYTMLFIALISTSAFAMNYACFINDDIFEVVDASKRSNYSNCKTILNAQHKLKSASCSVSYFVDDNGNKKLTGIVCRGSSKEDVAELNPKVRSLYK